MAARPKRSRKRSATKRTAPPEPLHVFIDECLGRHAVADALRAAGVTVTLHHERFPEGTDDAAWLSALAGDANLVVFTKDTRIRRRTIERQAMETAGLKVFALSSGSLPGAEQAAAFVRALPRIRRLARTRGPFIARITRTGSVAFTT